MKQLTAEEILTIIEETGISESEFAYGNFGAPDGYLEKYPDLVEKQKTYGTFHKQTWEEMKKVPKEEWPENPWKEATERWLEEIGIGKWEEVDSYGGEDCGSEWYSVKFFKDHNVYIRTDGYYQSHHGTDFHNGYGREVKPKKVTVTKYV